jgi:hypothetical protein
MLRFTVAEQPELLLHQRKVKKSGDVNGDFDSRLPSGGREAPLSPVPFDAVS